MALEISLSPVSTALTSSLLPPKQGPHSAAFPFSTAHRYRSFPSVLLLLSSSSTHPISAFPPACSPSLVSSLPSCASSLKTLSSLTCTQLNPPLPLPAWWHLPLPPNTLHFHCLEMFSSKSTQDPFQFGFVLWFRYLLQPVKAKWFFFSFFGMKIHIGKATLCRPFKSN